MSFSLKICLNKLDSRLNFELVHFFDYDVQGKILALPNFFKDKNKSLI